MWLGDLHHINFPLITLAPLAIALLADVFLFWRRIRGGVAFAALTGFLAASAQFTFAYSFLPRTGREALGTATIMALSPWTYAIVTAIATVFLTVRSLKPR